MAVKEITTDGLPPKATVAAIILVFISIALHNVIELYIKTFGTFRRYRGFYFWSVIVATTGIAFNSVGYLLEHLKLSHRPHVNATLILIGWCTMITGQSCVLYSRLHLVLKQQNILRAVLIMIIANAIWLHIPVIVIVYGLKSNNPEPFRKPYAVYERLQLTVFILQEAIISGIYVWKTTAMLAVEKAVRGRRTTRVLNHLVYVNIIIVILDISILGLEYANQFTIQTAWKPFVYSVKLKMEFSILNRLMEMVKPNSSTGPRSRSGLESDIHKSVALSTVPQDRTRRQTGKEDEYGANGYYTAHVRASKYQKSHHNDQNSVLKTTEIQVHTQERQDELEDSLSLDGRSETTGDLGRPGVRGTTSASSSEIQFAYERS